MPADAWRATGTCPQVPTSDGHCGVLMAAHAGRCRASFQQHAATVAQQERQAAARRDQDGAPNRRSAVEDGGGHFKRSAGRLKVGAVGFRGHHWRLALLLGGVLNALIRPDDMSAGLPSIASPPTY